MLVQACTHDVHVPLPLVPEWLLTRRLDRRYKWRCSWVRSVPGRSCHSRQLSTVDTTLSTVAPPKKRKKWTYRVHVTLLCGSPEWLPMPCTLVRNVQGKKKEKRSQSVQRAVRFISKPGRQLLQFMLPQPMFARTKLISAVDAAHVSLFTPTAPIATPSRCHRIEAGVACLQC